MDVSSIVMIRSILGIWKFLYPVNRNIVKPADFQRYTAFSQNQITDRRPWTFRLSLWFVLFREYEKFLYPVNRNTVKPADFQRYTAFSQNQITEYAWLVIPVLPHNALHVSLRIVYAPKFKSCLVLTHPRLLPLIVYVTRQWILKSRITRCDGQLIIIYRKQLSLWYYA